MNSNLHSYIHRVSILVLVFVVTSCVMQKRHYRNGYAFFKHHRVHELTQTKKTENSSLNYSTSSDVIAVNDLVASARGEFVSSASEHKNLITSTNLKTKDFNLASNACDTVFLNNGVKMVVKVINAGSVNIIYKKCETGEDELLNIETSKVSYIHFSNGKEINFAFSNDEKYRPQHLPSSGKIISSYEAEKGSEQARLGMMLCFLGIVCSPSIIVGIILGVLARKKLKGKKGYEKEYNMATFLTVLGVLLIVLTVFAFIYLFAFM